MFRTPEQTVPPQVLIRANDLAKASGEIVASPLLELRNDRQLLESHLANLPDGKRQKRGQIDAYLAIARAKIEAAESFDEAMDHLTPLETFAVLKSPAILRAV